MTVLADTSIWIDYLRGTEPTASQLDRLIESRELVMCGPVLAELLAGAAPACREELTFSLTGLRLVELDTPAWVRAGVLASELRQSGAVVPLADVLIAVAAIQAGADLWTRDRDFARVREVERGLRLREDA